MSLCGGFQGMESAVLFNMINFAPLCVLHFKAAGCYSKLSTLGVSLELAL